MYTARKRRALVFSILLLAALLLSSVPVPAGLAGTELVSRPPSLPQAIPVAASIPTIMADGPTHRSLFLEGTNSYVRVPNHSNLNPTAEITIEAWVWRANGTRCETVVGKDYTTSYWLGFCPDHVRFYAAGLGTAVDGSAVIPAGRWTHVAVTYDGTTRRYYVNGALDLETTDGSGALVDNSADVGIGRDLDTFFTENNFMGYLDEVRIWDVVRTQAEIQENMDRQILSQAGLVEAWQFNGNPWGVRRLHNGVAEGSAEYRYPGALPRQVTIPLSAAGVTVDGYCDLGEYGGAERVGIESATAYLQHDADDVYICFEGLERGANRFATVAFDRDYSRDDPAQPGDYRLTLGIDGSTSAEEGDGAGGFVPLSPAPGSWDAAHALVSEFFWGAEFRFNEALLDVSSWYEDMGLYLAEIGRYGGDGLWPVRAAENLPSTWARADFINYGGTLPTFSFSGEVLRQRDNAGVAGAVVHLFASTSASTSLVDSYRTDSTGAFSLSYTGYGPSSFIVQETDPRGLHSIMADGGADGAVRSANVVLYPGAESSHVYSPATFVDADARLTGQDMDRHYLIVYSEPVGRADLWPLIELKQMEGYQLETISTQLIEVSVSGRDLPEKIRNWLKGRWEDYDPAPVYALLVGRHDVIPARQVGWEGDLAHRTPEQEGYAPAVLTEWYYADLDSDWDSDGDGFYGEYIYCAPGEEEVPSLPWPVRGDPLPCPPAGSPLREGPYGTDPGPDDDWRAEIAIGRLEVNDPAEVRIALQTSADSESSGSLDKRNSLIGGAFWSFRGRSWDAENDRYEDGKGPDIWRSWPGEGNQPYGNDTAEHLEVDLKPILALYMDNVTRLYETTSPGGDPDLVPTRFTPDAALTQANAESQWSSQGYGLVNAEGHGSAAGVWALHWTYDWNDNRQIDNPANPAESPTCTWDNCWELTPWEAFVHRDMPAPGGIAPIVFANACSTGDAFNPVPILDPSGEPTGNMDWQPRSDMVAGRLPAQGRAAAWIGGISIVPVGAIDDFQDQFNQDILGGPLLLGDALWKNMAVLIGNASDWRRATLQLFGDPAYAYWGNPADTLAPWPQDGHDWRATGATAFPGPSIGRVAWVTTEAYPHSAAAVDRYGNVLFGATGTLFKYAPDGTKVDEVILDTVPPGLEHAYAPALATDGVYLASTRQLYVLDRDLDLREMVAIDGAVTGAVRVGPDGVAWVPTNEGMFRVTGAGLAERIHATETTGPAALAPSGAAIWTTGDNVLHGYLVDRRGEVTAANVPFVGSGPLTPPALGGDGSVYVGTDSGHVVAVKAFPFHPSPELWSYHTGAAISARPAVGSDGAVYVGNTAGVVYAFSAEGTLRWSRPLATTGAPAVLASPTADDNRLYVAAGSSLYALSLGTGDLLWALPLGGSLDARSSPVIGSNGLYVTRSDGALVAVAEYGWLLPPSDVTITPGIGEALVNWRDNSLGEIGFQVETCTVEGACTVVGSAAADATSLLVGGLAAGEPFYIRVQATGVAGDGTQVIAAQPAEANYSSGYAYANLVYALPALPIAPTNLTAVAASAEAISLTWTYGGPDAESLTGFAIYRGTGPGGPYKMVGTIGASAAGFIDQGLDPNTLYDYQIAALNESGASPQAGPVSATTKSTDLPRPTNLTAIQRHSSMVLSWTDNATSELGYLIERRPPGVGDYEIVGAQPANTTVFTDVVNLAGGQYTYRVKAFNATAESLYAYRTVTYGESYAAYLPIVWK